MPIILTSSGLSSKAILDAFTGHLNSGLKKAAIIVTAAPEFRENNWLATRTKNQFEQIGFESNYFDIECYR